jgi:hypothetical protein
MNQKVPAFIMTRSGRIRDGLAALLRAVPQIGPIHYIKGDLTELKSISDQNQTLILLDASLITEEVWRYMEQAKKGNGQIPCKWIVLADTVLQQRQARAAGADEVLLAGFPATQFFDTIDNLFDRVPVPVVLDEIRRKNGATAT